MFQSSEDTYILRSNQKSQIGSQFDVRQAPSPLHQMHSQYQLTFKKEGVGSYMFQSPKNSKKVSRQLFKLNKQSEEQLKNLGVKQFVELPIQKMRQFPYQSLANYSQSSNNKIYILKIQLFKSIYQVKCLRIKIVNAETNLNILTQSKTKSQQQQHKQYLFRCLVMQLRKKLFIQALKYNFYFEKYKKVNAEKNMIKEEIQNQSEEERQVIKQVYYNKFAQNETGAKSLASGREDARALILNQVIQSIVKAQLYHAFKILQCIQLTSNGKKQQFNHYIYQGDEQEQQYSGNIQHSQSQFIYPIHSQSKQKQELGSKLSVQYSNQKFYQNSGQAQDIFHPQQEIQRIQNFIYSLKASIADDDSDIGIMKNYFIRWRIYFLRKVIKMIQKEAKNNQKQGQEYQNQKQINKQPRGINYQRNIEQQNLQTEQFSNNDEQENYRHRNSTSQFSASAAESQISQSNNLKIQKKMLKQFIFRNQISLFLEQLHSYSAYNKIKRICKKIYTENLLKKGFRSLKKNLEDKYKQIQLQQYYEQVAQQQYEDGIEAKLFYKTNLLFQSFNHWKKYHRCLKMQKALLLVIQIVVFKKIKYMYLRGKHMDDKVSRFIFYKQQKLLFKTFNSLRCYSETTGTVENLQKCKEHIAQKKHMMKQYIFNFLHFQSKNTKVKTLKAQRFWHRKQTNKIFMILKQHYIYKKKDAIENDRRNYQIYRLFASKFISKMSEYVYERQKYKQEVVIVAKMQQFIKIKRAKKMLVYWRKKHLKNRTYQAIQLRLSRLIQKSNVERIYKIWKEQANKKLQEKDNKQQSGQHSNWLKKYYANLCELQK